MRVRAYKVVKPSWIVDSVKAGRLLPWTQYQVIAKPSAQRELSFQPRGEDLNAALLANEWNRRNTTTNPDFIQRYYKSSRLHYLSTWKAELKEIVRKMEQKFPPGSNGSAERQAVDGHRVIMYVCLITQKVD